MNAFVCHIGEYLIPVLRRNLLGNRLVDVAVLDVRLLVTCHRRWKSPSPR